MKDNGHVHLAPGFVPTQFQGAEAPGSSASARALSRGIYDRVPRTQGLSFSTDSAAVALGTVRVTVGAPSLFTLLDSNIPNGNPIAQRASFEFFWRPVGDADDLSMFSLDAGRCYFTGPHAWFPRAGSYQVYAFVSLASIASVTFQAEVRQGFGESEWLALCTGRNVQNVVSAEQNLTLAGGRRPLGTSGFYPSHFRVRTARIQNIGAGNAFVSMGNGGAVFIVPSGGTFPALELPPELLGRGTLSVTVGADTSIEVQLGTW